MARHTNRMKHNRVMKGKGRMTGRGDSDYFMPRREISVERMQLSTFDILGSVHGHKFIKFPDFNRLIPLAPSLTVFVAY